MKRSNHPWCRLFLTISVLITTTLEVDTFPLHLVTRKSHTTLVTPIDPPSSSSSRFYRSLNRDDDELQYYQQSPLSADERVLQDAFNQFVLASRDSFKNVERATDFLLEKQPWLALTIFVGAGLLVAYISGFFILCGYIDSINPAENNAVPYWE